jgi:hypothetical protein
MADANTMVGDVDRARSLTGVPAGCGPRHGALGPEPSWAGLLRARDFRFPGQDGGPPT